MILVGVQRLLFTQISFQYHTIPKKVVKVVYVVYTPLAPL